MTLADFPEDWTRALAIAAHPDDMEYGAAGAVARWTRQGKSVSYLLATRGEAGIDSMPPERAAQVRTQEEIASAAIVGVGTVEFLAHADGIIEYGLPLRRDIAAAIRRHQPELIITVNHHEKWPGGWLNMADHKAVGLATLDAVRDAANRWVFSDLDIEPWSGVRWVGIAGSPHATHAVDISETLDAAIASLDEHRAYLDGLGDHEMADPREFLRRMADITGEQYAGRPACAFELISM